MERVVCLCEMLGEASPLTRMGDGAIIPAVGTVWQIIFLCLKWVGGRVQLSSIK